MSKPLASIPVVPKRPRSTNFTLFESECLVNEVLKRVAIIENKQTDAVTWKAKKDAWNEVTETFNSVTAGNRTAKNLKSKYECIKSALRKKRSAEKTAQYTKGVAPVTSYTPCEEKLLLSVDGLVSDSDAVNPIKTDIIENASFFELDSASNETVMEVNNLAELDNVPSTTVIDNLPINKFHVPYSARYSWNRATLRAPRNKILKRVKNSTLTGNYTNMVTKRKQLIELQKKLTEQELLKVLIEIENLRKADERAEQKWLIEIENLRKADENLRKADQRAELEHVLQMKILEKQNQKI